MKVNLAKKKLSPEALWDLEDKYTAQVGRPTKKLRGKTVNACIIDDSHPYGSGEHECVLDAIREHIEGE